MKRFIYQCLYNILLLLSNHINSKFIAKQKVVLGTLLLVLINVSQKAKSSNVTNYEPSAIDNDTVKIQAVEPDKLIEEEDVYCYDRPREPYEMPEFPGGMSELMNYLAKAIRFPEKAVAEGLNNGRVHVAFFVNEDGSVSDAEIFRSTDSLFNKEALRVVNAMPHWKPAKWIPGRKREGSLRIKYTVPVYFRLKE